MEQHRLKDATAWTPADVHTFLQEILPGHGCIENFLYTSGFVLCSLSKEDLRRQARDEQASNVIWAELQACRQAAKMSGTAVGVSGNPENAEPEVILPPTAITIYICTHSEVLMELDVLTSDTVLQVKERVAAEQGTALERQRLVFNGVQLEDARSLASFSVHHGSKILLAPRLRDGATARPPFAPRGLLMVPGNKPWDAGLPNRPYIPVIGTDVTRNFAINLEFRTIADRDTFKGLAALAPSVLEVRKLGDGFEEEVLAETKVLFNKEAEGVTLDAGSNFLSPSLKYEALVHYGGQGGELPVRLVTGPAEGNNVN